MITETTPLVPPVLEGEQVVHLLSYLWCIPGYGEFRIVSQDKKHLFTRCFVPLVDGIAHISDIYWRLIQNQPQHSRLTFGLNPRSNNHHGRNQDVDYRIALFTDLDPASKENPVPLEQKIFLTDRLTAAGLVPTACSASGRGFHLLYFLDHSVPNGAESEAVARRLCQAVSSDGVHYASAVPRLPGSTNWRNPGSPVQCKLVWFAPERRYSLEYITWALDQVGAPMIEPNKRIVPPTRTTRVDAGQRSAATSSPSTSSPPPVSPPPTVPIPPLPADLRPDLLHHVTAGTPHGQRSELDLALCRALLLAGWSTQQVWSLFLHCPATCGSKLAEAGPSYMERTLAAAQDHLATEGQHRRPATISHATIAGVEGAAIKIRVDLLLADQDAPITAWIDGPAGPRWTAFWAAVGHPAPATPAAVREALGGLQGRGIVVETGTRRGRQTIIRFHPPRCL